jgi:uncharacterized protein (TIGR00251 family)
VTGRGRGPAGVTGPLDHDVELQPRASRTEVVGWRDGRLRLRVTAPPVEGAANAALVALLAESLGVPRRAVSVVAGAAGRRKRVRVEGVDAARLAERLGKP